MPDRCKVPVLTRCYYHTVVYARYAIVLCSCAVELTLELNLYKSKTVCAYPFDLK